jgi:hypothetical protein
LGEIARAPAAVEMKTAGLRHALPTNFRAYVANVFLPQRRKKWKDSTGQTTTEHDSKHT